MRGEISRTNRPLFSVVLEQHGVVQVVLGKNLRVDASDAQCFFRVFVKV